MVDARPANVSAKLAPKDPDQVAGRLSAAIRARVPGTYRDTFGGTVVMDANDIGRNVLGKDAPGPKEREETMFADKGGGELRRVAGPNRTPRAVRAEHLWVRGPCIARWVICHRACTRR